MLRAGQARKTFSPYARNYPTRAYFGDTHLHTANSGDAFTAGNRLSPEQAYRFALGEEVVSSSGVPARLSRPLDFLVVTDHAEGLGIGYRVYEGDPALDRIRCGTLRREDAARGPYEAPGARLELADLVYTSKMTAILKEKIL